MEQGPDYYENKDIPVPPGIIGAAFDAGATVELICDGFHIHPSDEWKNLPVFRLPVLLCPLSSIPADRQVHILPPAKAIGMEREIGCIRTGARADLLILDEHMELEKVIIGGQIWQ